MDQMLATIRTELPRHATGEERRDAILIHIYPTGPSMGSRYVLNTNTLVIGRGEGCEIRIDDNSVSRRHASVQPAEGGYGVKDLGSTNGTFLNDESVKDALLRDGDYLRVGNCIYRFLTGGNVEAEYHEEIYRLTIIDGLTEIHNKRYFLEFLERELARSARHGRPLSLVMFDIDRFKRINDELGHLAGDYALREMAGIIKGTVRHEELFARYGGEEFALVLPETTRGDASGVAERLRALVEGHHFEYDGEAIPVTISLGVADIPGYRYETPQELIRKADEALYRAKQTGRNRVCIYTEEEAGGGS